MSNNRIIIIGAGLSGSLLAIRLAQKGFAVAVYEKRPDMRKATISAGRSINLALSDRGIRGLRLIGLENEMLELSIPMYGRMIHPLSGEPILSPYSGRTGEYINSISRGELNIALLNKAEGYKNIEIHFDCSCTEVQLSAATAFFKTKTGDSFSVTGTAVIGTDGAGSALRDSMEKELPGFTVTQEFLDHGYKELNLPPGVNNSFQIEKNALHIWPRGSFMLIALPNLSGDFTLTLFLAHKGAENSFEVLPQKEQLHTFFKNNFPDALALIPDLNEQFFDNPTGLLGTVKCFPWQAYGKCLLLGDAAHAVVPFYGQGMNCSFEDVVVFDQLLEQYGDHWNQVFTQFELSRKENADAIADLAVDNFYEMRDRTTDPVFQRKRKLENMLEQKYPRFFSKYSLVTFREDVPYKNAMEQGRKQDDILMKICTEQEDIAALDLNAVLSKLSV
jgi:kynurenine 3-monooxygenase